MALVPETGDGFLTASFTVAAVAVGTDTSATGDVSVQLITRGPATFAFGTATLTATALASAGQTADTDIQQALDVSGADLFIERRVTATGNGSIGTGSWSSDMAQVSFFALEFQGLTFLGGPITVTDATASTISSPPATISSDGGSASAAFDASAIAIGVYPGLSTQAITQTLAIAGEVSSGTATAMVDSGRPEAGATPSGKVYRQVGCGNTALCVGEGDNWVFAGGRKVATIAGNGNNTIFTGGGPAVISAGNGDNWVFASGSRNLITLGNGDNIVYGGAGDDVIVLGSGTNAVCAGRGNDIVKSGAGNDTFLLGTPGQCGDGQDVFTGGGGSDWYLLTGAFGSDVITDFRVRDDDRLIMYQGAWGTDKDLQENNGKTVWLQRTGGDARDLQVTLNFGGSNAVMTLSDFFVNNPAYAGIPRWGVLSDAQALPLLRSVFVSGTTSTEAISRNQPFIIGDQLSILSALA
ncbi:calcium-binding protein [Rhodovastum atsumiense]|uniref:Calcium-binding protein n=1 Tax=Rhodovastum atsumiense TaxID=504468 RepID=A0A5M6IMX7_9PROT|nr:calcium-binding protein [Rhodovastum atsumiense]